MEKIFKKQFGITPYDVFILETVAIVTFGSSWLIKGKAIRDILDLKKKLILRFKND